MNSLETVILSATIPIIGSLIMILINSRNAKVQTEGLIADQYYKLTERLKQERDELMARIAKTDGVIERLERLERTHKREIRTLMEDNEECKYLHEVAELEMKQIKHLVKSDLWKREKIFILDDDPDVLDDFKEKFSRLSVLDYDGFMSVDVFLQKAKEEKPNIVVLDYLLDYDRTASYVIENLGYKPEVFIMSGEESFQAKFESGTIQFFVKDQYFILKITKAIIQYLLKRPISGTAELNANGRG